MQSEHAARPEVRTSIQVRYSDLDLVGHVNNAVYATYAEVGRVAYFRAIDYDVARQFVVVRLECDYRAQITLLDEVEVTARLDALGTTSFVLAQSVIANGKVAAELRVTAVYYDPEARAARPLPEALRRAMAGEAS